MPSRLTQREVNDWLAALPGVREVHDLHIWGLSTTETALTAHLVCGVGSTQRSLDELATALHDRFRIGHTTIQIETETEAASCRLRPAEVI